MSLSKHERDFPPPKEVFRFIVVARPAVPKAWLGASEKELSRTTPWVAVAQQA
jgi:hypothetical protein